MTTGALGIEDINLTDSAFWARPLDERAAAFKVLRDQDELPFFEEEDLKILPQGPGYKALTRHEDVVEAARRAKDFCSGQGAINITDMPEELNEYFGSLINMDDPRHAHIRRIVSRAFSPRMVQKFEEKIDEVAAGVVADLKAGNGTGDFVVDVAARVPLQIICEMMGIPPEHYKTVFDNSNIILAGSDPEYMPSDPEGMFTALLTAGQTMKELVEDLGRQRKENPTDDLTSALVNANIDGESLTEQELGSFFILLAVAGNETTRNAIAHALHLFTTHPEQKALLMEDFEGRIADAVEEVVRYASPVIWMRRTATCDTELNGHQIKEGEKVLLYFWAANRDERVFENPEKFDILRSKNPHVAFGGPGPHFCLGAHLARWEITTMLRELFHKMPEIRAGEPDRLLSNFINGIKHLPYEF